MRLFTRVRRGLIRVDADELTYPAHVILRFEIERALIAGEIEAEDIPNLWAQKMQDYLGVDIQGSYENGCLQDIHWPMGMFGYFPSYTLGAMYAAQYFAPCVPSTNLDAQVQAGNLSVVMGWLDTHIWSQASRWNTDALVQRATGEPLNPFALRAALARAVLG